MRAIGPGREEDRNQAAQSVEDNLWPAFGGPEPDEEEDAETAQVGPAYGLVSWNAAVVVARMLEKGLL